MATDVRVPMAVILEAFGVTAMVARPAPDDEPIETTAVWLPPVTEEQPTGAEFSRRARVRTLCLPRSVVPTVPKGTRIVAPETDGEEPREWVVTALESLDVDETRVNVLPAEDA